MIAGAVVVRSLRIERINRGSILRFFEKKCTGPLRAYLGAWREGTRPLAVSLERRRGCRHEEHEHDGAENSVGAGTEKSCRFCKQTYRARILIESARFPPFGFDTVERSSSLNEGISFLQKDLLCLDSDRERSVSPLRVRYSGDQL